MNLYTPDHIDLLITQIKDARDVVRLSLEGRLPAGSAFATALAEQGKITVTEDSPAVISQDVLDIAPDTLGKIKANGGKAVAFQEALIADNLHINGQQHHVVEGRTIPLVTVNWNRDCVYVAVSEEEDGSLNVPGGFISGPDSQVENLVDQLAFSAMDQFGNVKRSIGVEAARFTNPNAVCKTFNEKANGMTAKLYTGLEDRVIFACAGQGMTWSIPANLKAYKGFQKAHGADTNVIDLYGYALINMIMNVREEGRLAAINPANANKKGVLLGLNEPRDWDHSFAPCAATLQSPAERSRLARALRLS